MNVMTKQGSLDNVITYEHYCDTKADLANIPKSQMSLGSVAIVLKDENDGLGVYIATSTKEWVAISMSSSGSDEGQSSTFNLLHICTSDEYDSETGEPTIDEPEENIIYLVPNNGSSNNLFDEWIYANESWEKFGGGESATIEIPQSNWNENDTTSPAYIQNRICYEYETYELEYLTSITGNFSNGSYSDSNNHDELIQYGELKNVRVEVDENDYYIVDFTISQVLSNTYANTLHSQPLWIDYTSGSSKSLTIHCDDIDDGEHTIDIYRSVATPQIKKIDSKFIPTPDWNAASGAPGYIANKPAITSNSLTLGSTTLTEVALQNLLSLTSATGVNF